MTAITDPKRLARLYRDLARALEELGVDPSGNSTARHLMDDARQAANELDPPAGDRRPGRLIAF